MILFTSFYLKIEDNVSRDTMNKKKNHSNKFSSTLQLLKYC